MNIQTMLLAICVWCGTIVPANAATHESQECFANLSQLRQVHKTEHAWRHQTPNGLCWHIGPKNHSGVFAEPKASPKKIGVVSFSDPWMKAKPVAFGAWINQLADEYNVLHQERDYGRKIWFPAGR